MEQYKSALVEINVPDGRVVESISRCLDTAAPISLDNPNHVLVKGAAGKSIYLCGAAGTLECRGALKALGFSMMDAEMVWFRDASIKEVEMHNTEVGYLCVQNSRLDVLDARESKVRTLMAEGERDSSVWTDIGTLDLRGAEVNELRLGNRVRISKILLDGGVMHKVQSLAVIDRVSPASVAWMFTHDGLPGGGGRIL
ncbi:hypothetical protein FACS1894186_1960 [Alphaproteobacteria bacterium]|nr:hypothetical protein FACS1894186_1960 [Alphaproteobacteria bacterium]